MRNHQVLLFWLILTIWSAESRSDVQPGDESRGKKHHLLFLMGGLKSIAALVLIKIKIVLAVAAVVAVVMFTIKYLMGAAGLPGLFYKEHVPPALPPPHYLPHAVVHEPIYGYAAAEFPSPQLDHHYSNHEIHDVHDAHNGYEFHNNHNAHNSYETLDGHNAHNGYQVNEWSKMGDGGRGFIDILNLYPELQEILIQNFFHQRKKKMRKRDLVSSSKKHS